MHTTPLYRQLANHYLDAIRSGTLKTGERFPSIRLMMEKHAVSLSTAVQVCRELEDCGVLEARPRSGNYIRQPDVLATPRTAPPPPLDSDIYAGIHQQVSLVLKASQRATIEVNFASACCAPELYPLKALQDPMIKALRRAPQLLGTTGTTAGHIALRTVLARRALTAKTHLSAEQIVITHGATEAINLALRAVTRPGDTVAVESPTSYGLLQIIESLNLRVQEVPASAHAGINLFALEQLLNGPGRIKALIVMPNLQNPLGSIMPDAHKARLVQLCAEHNTVLIEDDSYGELVDNDQPLSTLKHWDRTDNVIYCASLNKTLAPGLRLGWISAGRWHARVEMLKYTQSRGCDTLAQVAVSGFMRTPSYERYLRRLRKILTQQRQQMSAAILKYFPGGTRVTRPRGGTLLWVELPREYSSMVLFHEGLKAGIQISPGDIFSNDTRFNHFVRIGCGAPYSPQIDEALATLGQLLNNQR
ncbi:Histidinol-phosphate aminotransferase [Pseudomonas fluorescens]|uniref:Histidinol-phosphate aminotransferase n=1 Tax=Pseudomonas fluorescens TaxID=294 RepID=A0A5E6SBX0_PSEFL|nr:PLP-dependent aminotransferase family protein [Pseudomonas fluorescens]VVM78319.1 Histidinol-phosphate aminotransferase [Pseudomonas fluorescens]